MIDELRARAALREFATRFVGRSGLFSETGFIRTARDEVAEPFTQKMARREIHRLMSMQVIRRAVTCIYPDGHPVLYERMPAAPPE